MITRRSTRYSLNRGSSLGYGDVQVTGQLELFPKTYLTDAASFKSIVASAFESYTLHQVPIEYAGTKIQELKKETQPGAFIENWDIIKHFPAKIVEISENTVLMDCVMDIETMKIELLSFSRDLVESDFKLQEGNFIEINYFQRPGKSVHTFNDAKRRDWNKYFQLNDNEFDFDWQGDILT